MDAPSIRPSEIHQGGQPRRLVWGDVMEEGTNKAIPLRRSRTRALTVRPRRWSATLTAGVRRAFEPPRQVWLASLGAPALVVRSLQDTWGRLVAEGIKVEATLSQVLRLQSATDAPARDTATP